MARLAGSLVTTTAAMADATSAHRAARPATSAIARPLLMDPPGVTAGAAASSGATTGRPVLGLVGLGRAASVRPVPGPGGSGAAVDHAQVAVRVRPAAPATTVAPPGVTATMVTDGHRLAVTATLADRQIDGLLPSRHAPRSATSGPVRRAVRGLAICCTDETPSWRRYEPDDRSVE